MTADQQKIGGESQIFLRNPPDPPIGEGHDKQTHLEEMSGNRARI